MPGCRIDIALSPLECTPATGHRQIIQSKKLVVAESTSACKSKASMARRRSDRRMSLIFFTLLSMVAFATLFPVYAFLPSFSTQSHHPHHGKNGATGKFEIAEDMFWKDGEPFQIIGGDLHYFRILPEYWEDRLLRAKALGLNTIQTYVPWNLHEPKPGQYAFGGIADLVSFLKLCKKLNLLVMLRAGPYICAEWDFGGFPAWLLAIEPALRIRSSDSAYLQYVGKWWGILLPKLAPLLYSNGGPIIMVQIENEYGSYGDDRVYLRHLVKQARAMLGEDIILYTTDGGAQENLEKGTVGGDAVFSAVDFSTGDDPWPIFKLQKKFNAPGKSPPLSSEFYTGWLTHWGEKIQMTSAATTATFLEKILSKNGSAVLYMAHGGTNFGFYNGANAGDDRDYKPDITSYDYDAPIKESGDLDNEKFEAIRKVIQKYTSTLLPSVPDNNEKAAYGSVHLQKTSSLFELVNSMDSQHIVDFENPVPMESVGQMFGYLLYVSQYVPQNGGSTLVIPKVHDRAQVFVSCSSWVSGRSLSYIGTIERQSNQSLFLPNSKCVSHVSLYILVENMGRINYGQYMFDRKGILSPVYLDGRILRQWKMISIPLQNLNDAPMFNPIVEAASSKPHKVAARVKLEYGGGLVYNGPAFYTGRFIVDKVKDTYISFRGWGKGVAFVNHFNIGRYWPTLGPQCNLYVPAPILQDGENTLVLFELEAPNPELGVQFVDHSDFHCGLSSRNVSKL